MAEYPALDLTFLVDGRTPSLIELLHAALDDFAPLAIHDRDTAEGWRVFFRHPHDRAAAGEALVREFGDAGVSVSAVDVRDDEWARRSQAHLAAVRAGRIIVAPPWAVDPVEDGCVLVVIQPSTGFGTGHHATTRLCLRLLQAAEVSQQRVIDVGTGSGVLAIAARKLGAREAIALDVDPDALRNARENAQLNGPAATITAIEADLATLEADPADVVLANLTASVLLREAEALARLAAPGGRLIVSGFAPADLAAIESAFGTRAAATVIEDGWAAALFNR